MHVVSSFSAAGKRGTIRPFPGYRRIGPTVPQVIANLLIRCFLFSNSVLIILFSTDERKRQTIRKRLPGIFLMIVLYFVFTFFISGRAAPVPSETHLPQSRFVPAGKKKSSRHCHAPEAF